MVKPKAPAPPATTNGKKDEELRGNILRASASARKLQIELGGTPNQVVDQVQNVFQTYAPLAYYLPWQVLGYVELLATYNADYSQAVDNIRTLANSGHEVFVEGKSELASRRIKSLIESKARTIQEQHGGIDGVIDKLLDQAATYGAMCGEWVVDENLTEVVDFIDVNPKLIRFFWDEPTQQWWPHQRVTRKQAQEAERNGQSVKNGQYVELNPETFRYYAFDAAPGSPYGTPPFIAALSNIAIQQDMQSNLAQIVKKIGLLAIVDLTINTLPKKPGESDEEYTGRAAQYLDAYVDVVEDTVRDGGIVHFEDVELKTTQISGNAAGATAIFKQNEEQIFSGLKSMPSVQGRSYSTTETYAGVAYDIIIRNTRKYQRAVKRMMEHGYWLMATLAGEQPESIKLNFNKNQTLNKLRDAQADKLEIENNYMLWELGAIDQLAFCQRLGIANPSTPYDIPPIQLGGTKKRDDEEDPASEDGGGDIDDPDVSPPSGQSTR